MSKKVNIEELLKRRDRLTERIKELQEVELKGVAAWVQETTGCYSLAQLQKGGWSLVQKKPEQADEAEPDEEEAEDESGTDGTGQDVHNGHLAAGDLDMGED